MNKYKFSEISINDSEHFTTAINKKMIWCFLFLENLFQVIFIIENTVELLLLINKNVGMNFQNIFFIGYPFIF